MPEAQILEIPEKQKALRASLAFALSTILYPIPVIAAMEVTSPGTMFDSFPIRGYLFAVSVGLFLNLFVGLPLHVKLEKMRRTRLYHYLLAGAFAGGILTLGVFLIDYTSGGPSLLGPTALGALSGFCLAGLFWLLYYPKTARIFGLLDGFILAIATAVTAGFGLSNAHEKRQAEEHFKAKRAWIVDMPVPKFDQLRGPAPLTVTMLRPESWPEQPDLCFESYHMPLTKRPIYHQKQYVVWDDIQYEVWEGMKIFPPNFVYDHVYASELKKYCFWAKSHTYTKPGRYVIKLYIDYDHFTDVKQIPDHEIEVIVTDPNSIGMK